MLIFYLNKFERKIQNIQFILIIRVRCTSIRFIQILIQKSKYRITYSYIYSWPKSKSFGGPEFFNILYIYKGHTHIIMNCSLLVRCSKVALLTWVCGPRPTIFCTFIFYDYYLHYFFYNFFCIWTISLFFLFHL